MTDAQKKSHLTRFSRFQQSREKYFAPLINDALHRQYLTAAKNAHHGQRSGLLISSSEIAAILKRLYIDAAVVYGAKIRADFAKQGAYSSKNSTSSKSLIASIELKNRRAIGFSQRMQDQVTAYFQTDILSTAEGITQTTRDLITKIFTEAYAEGLGINDIVKKLEGTELSKIRARLIARTETVKSANIGARFVAIETGLLLNKTWLATKDWRTRPDHVEVDGHQVGRDDYFTVGESTMLQPGDETQKDGEPVPADEIINCRCTHTYQSVRDASGKLIRV